jgi:hypothetical protein
MKYGTEIIVFLIVFLIISILFSFYILVRKEAPMQYNFSPFPSVSPQNLPNANVSGFAQCHKQVMPCEIDQDCSKKCGPGYACTQVKKGQNVHVHGMKVPNDKDGTWCLPTGMHEQGCGTYTARAVWSSGPACGDKDQCWQCVCLYPSLYGNPEHGCQDPRACIDPSQDVVTKDPNQMEGNYLVGEVDGQTVKWDPLDKDWYPPNDLTPYALKSDNKTPVFQCQCKYKNPVGDPIKYVQLPNDPYNCHGDPCDNTHTSDWWDASTMECNCPVGNVKSPVDGICRGTKCAGGTWDADAKRCNCPTVSAICDSATYPRPGEPKCAERCFPGGSYCWNPCGSSPGENPCQPVLKEQPGCAFIPPSPAIHTDYGCVCPKGTHGKDASQPYCSVGCYDSNNFWNYNGKNCEKKCIVSGGIIASTDTDCVRQNYYSASECCNGTGSTYHTGTCWWPDGSRNWRCS